MNNRGRVIGIFAWLGLLAATAEAGPVSFLTALPVARAQVILRGQYVFIRASDDPTPQGRDLTVQAVPIAAAVGLTPRLAVFGIIPIVDKSLDVGTPGGRRTLSASGLGDVVAFARYTVVAVDRVGSTFRIAPFGGVKIPTGDDDRAGELGRLPRSLQPGSGSWDGLGGVVVSVQTTQWEFDADAGFRKTTDADRFRFGNQAFADASFQYRVWPRRLGGGVPGFVYAVVETNVVSQGRSQAGGVADPDSGGLRWDVDLGLQYAAVNYIVEGLVQIPVADNPKGTGLRSDYRVVVGLRWNLSLPF